MDNNTFHLVLASQSPRRRELLKSIFLPFSVKPADLDEKSRCKEPKDIVCDLAKQKAQAVFKTEAANSFVIGADTIVVFENTILGKPKDREEAKRTLEKLSGKDHEVLTGVHLICSEKESHFYVQTKVRFREIPDDLLELYLDTEESMDKAGAYGIQAMALAFIEEIQGSYSNVVGLPIDYLLLEIEKMAKEISETKEKWRQIFV